MDRFRTLQVFVKVAELGSFAATARQLAMSPPAVTRAIRMLEERMGTRLFIRTTRSVRLTDAAERFLIDARRILTELDEAEEAAVGSHSAPRGDLAITAPVLFGRMFVTPVLGAFLDQYPRVNAQTLYLDRIVNLMDEGIDVAIRIGELPDTSLMAVRVGAVRPVVVAAPGYMRKHGPIRHPDALIHHRLIQPRALGDAPWPFVDNGVPISVKTNPRLRMNTNDAVIELLLGSWGVSRLLSYQVAPYIEDGRLQRLLGAYELPPMPVHVVHREGRLVSAKIRSFVDFMADHLRADPALKQVGI